MLGLIRKASYLWNCKRGFCPVCSRQTLFLLTGSADTARNHALCIHCKSASRHRHLAAAILNVFSKAGVRKLSDFKSQPGLKVYHTCSTGPIAEALGRSDNIIFSEYFDDVPPGKTKDGVLCQNLEALTFPDASLDLVISEDVFEHLRDYRKGFAEVFRVLKPGGYHVFTIPYYFDRRTKDLFDRRGDELVLREPVEYHGDPVRGQIPTFTHFGYDLNDFLDSAGFETRIEISDLRSENKFGTFDCYTFVTRRRTR